jgi:hypothetical protein
VHVLIYISFGTTTGDTDPVRIGGMPFAGTQVTGLAQNNGGFYANRSSSSRTDKFDFYTTGTGASTDYIRALESGNTEAAYEDYNGADLAITGYYITSEGNA